MDTTVDDATLRALAFVSQVRREPMDDSRRSTALYAAARLHRAVAELLRPTTPKATRAALSACRREWSA